MVTISLCMIVKNEEKILDRCLACVADLVDEVIIVDTGSVDKTKEIAGKYTDKIYDFEWVNDFAAARNYAFSKAAKEYIYSADADEVLDEVNRERFRILKSELIPEIEIVQMYYSNQLKFGSVYNYDREYRPKLFKRIRTFTWIDPIHETVRTEPVVFDSDIEIIHEQEQSHAARDIAAFQRVCGQEGTLSRRLHELYARELFIAGEKEDFTRAQEYFEAACNDAERSGEEIKEAACVIAKAARMNGDGLKFHKYATKVVASGGCAEICMELGWFYMDAGDYLEAAVWFYNAAFETESILDIHSRGDYPLLGLAECYRLIGSKEQEEEYRKKAMEWQALSCRQ